MSQLLLRDGEGPRGWVPVWRWMFAPNDPFWGDPERRGPMLDLYQLARWEVKPQQLLFPLRGRSGKPRDLIFTVQRGEVVTTRPWLAQRWGWKVWRVRHFVAYCQKLDLLWRVLRQKADRQVLHLYLVEYETWNPPPSEKTHGTRRQKAGNSQASRQDLKQDKQEEQKRLLSLGREEPRDPTAELRAFWPVGQPVSYRYEGLQRLGHVAEQMDGQAIPVLFLEFDDERFPRRQRLDYAVEFCEPIPEGRA